MSARALMSARLQGVEPSAIRTLRDRARHTSLDLGLGQTDLPIPEAARQALREHVDQPLRAPYCPNLGLASTREAVAAHEGVDPSQVMITCGVQQALAVALLGMVDPGDEVLIPDPGFVAYANLVRLAGAIPVPYALDAQAAWRLDPQRVQDAMTPRTRAIVLCSPGNPTGAVHAPEDLQAVLALCAQRGVAWISDEIYEDYVYEDHAHHSPLHSRAYAELGVKLGGLSKSHHMMGWRLGWLIASPALVEGLKGLHQHLVTSASTLSQQAAKASLAIHRQVIDHALPIFDARRRAAQEALAALPGVRCWPGQGAFYLFLDMRDFMPHVQSSHQLAMRLLDEADVILIPGEGFGAAGQGYLRLAYTVEVELLREAIARLGQFLRALDPLA